MREFVSSITRKGQVTIPAEVRRQLGTNTPGRIAFVISDDGRIEVKPGPLSLAEVYGSVPALPERDPGDFDDFIEEAMKVQVEQIVKSLEQP